MARSSIQDRYLIAYFKKIPNVFKMKKRKCYELITFCSGTFRFVCIRRKQYMIQSIYDLYQTFGNIDIFFEMDH